MSTRRNFLKNTGLSILSLLSFSHFFRCDKTGQRPNIVLIMADDFGYECLSCNGSTSYSTPNIDKLAATGVRFTHCYSTPLCTPSRVQLMTGKYNFRNYTEFGTLPQKEQTFAHLLQQAGYTTCVAGKWQLVGHYEGSNYKGEGTYPNDAGFDEYCLWQVDQLGSRYWHPVITENGILLETTQDQYGSDIVCNYINNFIKRHQSQPFFAYYPMILTHAPFEPTPNNHPSQTEKQKRNKKYYADMVSYVDQLVGRMIKNLDELGLRENTLVLFTGDNGSPRGISSQMGNRRVIGGKGKTINAGTHVPLIANWKNHSLKGSICEDLIDFTDFLPTILEAAHHTAPTGFKQDGRSFFPQILGKKANPRKWIYCSYDPKWGQWEKKQYVQNKKWKLYDNGNFFDLKHDPLEEHPLTTEQLDEESKRIKKEFEQVLKKMK